MDDRGWGPQDGRESVTAWVLIGGLGTLLVLVVATQARAYLGRAPGCKVLSPREASFLRDLSDAVFPAGEGIPVSGTEAGVPGFLDGYLALLPAPYRRLIRLLFVVVDRGALPLAGSLRGFQGLSADRRTAYLAGWEDSRFYPRRMISQSFKTLLCIAYMADPRVRRSMGFLKEEGCRRSAERDPSRERPGASGVPGVIQHGDRRRRVVRESVDVCIVGSGAAGSVLARELAVAGKRVIVLEEGSYWEGGEVPEEPAHALRLLFREAGFRACRGRVVVPTMQGRCVGGTTFVNSSICFRFPERILEEWRRDHGLDRLTTEALEPSYRRVEEIASIRPVDEEILGEKNRLFRKGAEALGIHSAVFQRAEKDCKGCSECMPACPTGAKQSTDRCYLPDAAEHGARIYADCRAEEIIVRNGQVLGVRGAFLDPHTGRADGACVVSAKAVILAAGVMSSPVLLLKNGLGNGSGWVGRNLVHHPGSALFGLFHEAVNPWEGATQGYGSGEYLEEDIKLEVIWGPPSYLAVRLPGFGRALTEHLARYRHAVAWDSMVRGASRGRVRAGAGWEPRITYKLEQTDVDKITRGLRIVAEMLFAAGAHSVLPGIYGLPARVTSMVELDGLRPGRVQPTQMVVVSNHAFGTCRMGADPAASVVDPWCQSHEVKDLYVCDTSVFPSGTGVNPMEPVMALADNVAQELKSRY